MSVIVVVRNNGCQWIFKGPITNNKINRIRDACGLRVKKPLVWTGEYENYVMSNYGKITASQIATNLTDMTGKRFTHNMVISRFHKLSRKNNENSNNK